MTQPKTTINPAEALLKVARAVQARERREREQQQQPIK